jgi:hypothetical protein
MTSVATACDNLLPTSMGGINFRIWKHFLHQSTLDFPSTYYLSESSFYCHPGLKTFRPWWSKVSSQIKIPHPKISILKDAKCPVGLHSFAVLFTHSLIHDPFHSLSTNISNLEVFRAFEMGTTFVLLSRGINLYIFTSSTVNMEAADYSETLLPVY